MRQAWVLERNTIPRETSEAIFTLTMNGLGGPTCSDGTGRSLQGPLPSLLLLPFLPLVPSFLLNP